MKLKNNFWILILLLSGYLLPSGLEAQECTFNHSEMSFEGTPVEQARCLLKPIKRFGHLKPELSKLPDPLEDLIGETVTITKDQVEAYLWCKGIDSTGLGGPLEDPLSTTSNGTRANYFVIHDTSHGLSGSSFPDNINEESWSGNDLSRIPNKSLNIGPHIFVNRLGESRTAFEFSTRRGGLKLQWRSHGGHGLKGLFIQVELIQPRIKDSRHPNLYHAVAPDPGFTVEQYDRLALLYVLASLRKGTWLIPSYHCVLDHHLPDGHDDPQNFLLDQWARQLNDLINDIKNSHKAGVQGFSANWEVEHVTESSSISKWEAGLSMLLSSYEESCPTISAIREGVGGISTIGLDTWDDDIASLYEYWDFYADPVGDYDVDIMASVLENGPVLVTNDEPNAPLYLISGISYNGTDDCSILYVYDTYEGSDTFYEISFQDLINTFSYYTGKTSFRFIR